MYKLWATILKDTRLLTRDKVGLALMFLMPILLVVVITSIQNATFDLVNNNKVSVLLCNKDKGKIGLEFKKSISQMGMFDITEVDKNLKEKGLSDLMKEKDVLLVVVIPEKFSEVITRKSANITSKSLTEFGLPQAPANTDTSSTPLLLFYNPVLQESFRQSVMGGLQSAQQLVESKQILKSIYFAVNNKELPDSLENNIVSQQSRISQIPVLRDGSRTIPNATQHNIPAWTIFAMFFIVISLGSNVVKEKVSGSSVRLRTLPTNYLIGLVSKQITYLLVCLVQVFVIFSIGIWLFPLINLPKLNMPHDLLGLLVVSVISGWCAVSYAICVGIFAETQEQANGFGAVSIVILAAIGGILVPSFAMPESFHLLLKISPLHWCLESYYGLFLEGGKFKDVLTNIVPLIFIIIIINTITLVALKKKNLI